MTFTVQMYILMQISAHIAFVVVFALKGYLK